MNPQTLQRLVHGHLKGWDDSVIQARQNLGYSFDKSPAERWEWAVSGNYPKVYERAEEVIRDLDVPDGFAYYWCCCFFSDYLGEDGHKTLTEVKGQPFLEVACPSESSGFEWTSSIMKGSDELATHTEEDTRIGWLHLQGGCRELGKIGSQEVKRLGLPQPYCLLWLCCTLPPRSQVDASPWS